MGMAIMFILVRFDCILRPWITNLDIPIVLVALSVPVHFAGSLDLNPTKKRPYATPVLVSTGNECVALVNHVVGSFGHYLKRSVALVNGELARTVDDLKFVDRWHTK